MTSQTPQELLAKLNAVIDNPHIILREVALAVLPELRHRVHVEGKDSAGNQIGTYSAGYMKLRTGNYKNSGRVSRGANKGKLKDAGVFTKTKVQLYGYAGVNVMADIESMQKPRPLYHRTNDTKVILSLTRQMENDLSAVETSTGYGIGYLNDFNYQKAIWCEETYKKPILSQLTAEELDYAETVAGKALGDFLNDNETFN